MGSPDRRRRSRSGQLLDSLVWGAALGAAAGAVLGAAVDGIGAGAGALIGVLLYTPAEAVTSLSRGAGEMKPLWQRIISSALLMALFGWLLGLIGLDEPLVIAIVSGALLGLLGLRPLKILLGVDPADGARERLAAAATVAHRCAAPVGMDSVRGVGVATPGVVDASGRVTITDVLPEWSGLSLADRLGGLVASPVLVENDATLAALAERRRGAAADVDDVLYILAGQRVGAGILLAGKPHRGHHGAAGELAYADFLGLKPVGLDQPRLAASAMGDESVAIGALRLALDDAHRRLLTI
jgi:ROK family